MKIEQYLMWRLRIWHGNRRLMRRHHHTGGLTDRGYLLSVQMRRRHWRVWILHRRPRILHRRCLHLRHLRRDHRSVLWHYTDLLRHMRRLRGRRLRLLRDTGRALLSCRLSQLRLRLRQLRLSQLRLRRLSQWRLLLSQLRLS